MDSGIRMTARSPLSAISIASRAFAYAVQLPVRERPSRGHGIGRP
jgi:hypothetical protein